jgi:type II secretion system (T2SS) protein M
MSGRDRMIAMVVPALVVLAAAWLLVVSPERKKAAGLQTQVSAASAQLAAAEGQAANARSAQAKYTAAYASLVQLGKAVPAGREVPSLVYELEGASKQKHVDFSSIVSGAGNGGGPGSGSAAPPTSGAALAGFTQMPFTFVFTGTFFNLYDLFQQLNRFTVRSASGDLQVSGRLLTIQSAKLSPLTNSSPGKGAAEELTGTITATAYVLPAAQGLTAGATSAGPGGTSPAASISPASSSAPAGSSPTAPALVRVTP